MSDLSSDLIPTRWEALGATVRGLRAYVTSEHGADVSAALSNEDMISTYESDYLETLESLDADPLEANYYANYL